MNRFYQDEQRVPKVLKIATIIIVAGELCCGIAGLILGRDFFFIGESLWAIAGFVLLLFHAYPTLGWKNCLWIMLIVGGVGFIMECLGCNFGLFFSKYIYLDYIPGPKLFGFNVYSAVAYAIGGYIIWGTVRSAVGQYNRPMNKKDLIFMPILGSILLAAVDLATDPYLSTIHQTHYWEETGVYYGIPWQNYLGWYLMAYIFYLLIAIVIYNSEKHNTIPAQPVYTQKKSFWIYPPVLYMSLFFQLPFYALIDNQEIYTTLSHGEAFTGGQIYKGVFIIMLAAMAGPAIQTIARVVNDDRLVD